MLTLGEKDRQWMESLAWHDELSVNEAGFWTIRDERCAIGIVLLAERTPDILVVQKAPVEGYEFSDMLSLPGGVVRAERNSTTFCEAIERSLLARARLETGLLLTDMKNLRLDRTGDDTVTRYHAKGKERFTLVLAARCDLRENFRPLGADKSVARAFMMAPPFPWSRLAPANRKIVARAFPNLVINTEDRELINEAESFCDNNAVILALSS